MPWTELPALAVGNVVEVNAFSKCQNQVGINVLHYRVSAVGAGNEALLGKFMEQWIVGNPCGIAYGRCLSDQAAFVALSFQVIFPAMSAKYFFASAAVGQVGGDLLPKQASGIIRKVSAVPGRRKGGRVYIPFAGENSNTPDGMPTVQYMDDLDLLGAFLFQNFTGGSMGATQLKPIIYQRSLPGDSRELAQYRPIRKWATQRRRGDFGAANDLPVV